MPYNPRRNPDAIPYLAVGSAERWRRLADGKTPEDRAAERGWTAKEQRRFERGDFTAGELRALGIVDTEPTNYTGSAYTLGIQVRRRLVRGWTERDEADLRAFAEWMRSNSDLSD